MDDADLTAEREAAIDKARLQAARNKANAIPPGEPGECELCGEDSLRLVNGACAPCRDKRRLP